MQVNEMIEKAQFVTDSTGKKRAVLLDYALWEELLELVEDSEDGKGGDRGGVWITRAANEVCAEVDTSLDPAITAMQWASLPKEEW